VGSGGNAERQPTLFEVAPSAQAARSQGESQAFSDPAFAGNKTEPVHRWVSWIAGFSSEFVRDVLSKRLHDSGTVLDPFAGVGTTLVEAALAGHHSIGFELNPYACLACRLKVQGYGINPEVFSDTIHAFRAYYRERVASDGAPTARPPSGFRTRTPFYSPAVLRKVLIFHDFVQSISEPNIQDLFRLAFAAVMVSFSNYSYEPSLGRRESAGKRPVEDYAVDLCLTSKLYEMRDDIVWFRQRLGSFEPVSEVINASFFEENDRVKPASVDLVVTSPPYLNNYHYNRNTRPQLYWLGLAKQPKDLETLEYANFGKYWQTVRGKERIELDFALPNSSLSETLEAIRHLHPHKGVYGGHGWANYAAAYFNDCHRFAMALRRLLKPGGTALVVLGNSILQGVMVPTDRYLAEIAHSVGLGHVSTHIPRVARVGDSIIQSDVRVGRAQDAHHLYEAVVELRNV
jgi:methylase of polypeptide subunit release factors